MNAIELFQNKTAMALSQPIKTLKHGLTFFVFVKDTVIVEKTLYLAHQLM